MYNFSHIARTACENRSWNSTQLKQCACVSWCLIHSSNVWVSWPKMPGNAFSSIPVFFPGEHAPNPPRNDGLYHEPSTFHKTPATEKLNTTLGYLCYHITYLAATYKENRIWGTLSFGEQQQSTIFIILHLFLQLALHFLKEFRSVKRGEKS